MAYAASKKGGGIFSSLASKKSVSVAPGKTNSPSSGPAMKSAGSADKGGQSPSVGGRRGSLGMAAKIGKK